MVNRYRRHRTAVYVGPILNDADPPRRKEGIARRRLVITGGRCPCGATIGTPYRHADGLIHVNVEHEDGCPAIDLESA